MGLKVALNHKTMYRYDRPISLGPQIIRLKPAPHSRTRLVSYSLNVRPKNHFLNWIQDPYGNFLARVVFQEKVSEFSVEVDLVADMTVYNPFDFFLEPEAERVPFVLRSELKDELAPYLAVSSDQKSRGRLFEAYFHDLDRSPMKTIDFLVMLNQHVQKDISYNIRMEQNIQSPEDTLRLRNGSCRDSALLLVELLRSCGFAARFVSGYLVQLVPDRRPVTGLQGPQKDFTDLHAWAEAYVPGAGWIGLDPTSGLLTGEGHIPLAASPKPGSAAPVEGLLEPAGVEFEHEMTLTRLHEEPRPLKPFPSGTRDGKLDAVGNAVDLRLEALGLHLTIGGEPTFVSDTDRTGDEWKSAAMGPTKKTLAFSLMHRLKSKWTKGAVIHSAQGKWYPGEVLPRWALSCFWRADGEPLWKDEALLADESRDYGFGIEDARRFLTTLTDILGVESKYIIPAYEDPMYFLVKERDLPPNVTPGDSKLKDPEERARLAQAFSRGLDVSTGFVLPLQKGSWKSGPWPTRAGRLVLLPGDSPAGLRLPLDSLPWAPEDDKAPFFPRDPQEPVRGSFRQAAPARVTQPVQPPQKIQEQAAPQGQPPLVPGEAAAWVVRTALVVQPREGRIYVFFPPVREAEDWFALAEAVEQAAAKSGVSIVLEGYQPPGDPRIRHFQITPDPGVIEVNLPPGRDWAEWKTMLTDLYEEAAQNLLSTEKFQNGGQVTGSGGGCHWILGGPTPAESPFLLRPDLLRSWLSYTNRHPSLSYAFAGLFIGPTSQAPRPDESSVEALHSMEIAFQELGRIPKPQPWLSDRLFRNLLVDGSGNTHRTEICIDKLFSPDSVGGRRGLVEFRSFEMAPHVDLALSQSLLLRALSVRFLENPFEKTLIRWGTALQDQWMLPLPLWNDFEEVLADLAESGFEFPLEPFQAHWEFRFPLLGVYRYEGMELELRTALEPWPVLGEEPGSGGTVRYVDSSLERVQVSAKNWDPARYALACRGVRVPLRPLDGGVYTAGIRFKAWKMPSGMHPTIPEDGTLVLNLVDLFSHRVVGGFTYHVSNPAGINSEEAPVNSFEAEARRAARFLPEGHTPGALKNLPRLADSLEFPHTLDLRRIF